MQMIFKILNKERKLKINSVNLIPINLCEGMKYILIDPNKFLNLNRKQFITNEYVTKV